MAKAQGALEYLTIVAVVIAIVAVVTLLVTNYFKSQNDQYFYASCREAASTCKMTLSASPSDPCAVCDSSCTFNDGTEIFNGAINCCKHGKPSEIYSGSPGC